MANPGGSRPPLPPYTSSDMNPSIYRRGSSYASVVSGQTPNTNSHPGHSLPGRISQPSATTSNLFVPSAYYHTNPYMHYSNTQTRGHGAGPYDLASAAMGMRSGRMESSSYPPGPFGVQGTFFPPSHIDLMRATNGRLGFFIPSYLRQSRYAERLEAAHRAREATIKENANTSHSHSIGSLSNRSSSVNLHKAGMASHRGVASEVIERNPVPSMNTSTYHIGGTPWTSSTYDAKGGDDGPAPLPSRWSETDKAIGLDILGGGLELKYSGMPKVNTDEAAAVRADHPMPLQCGIYYYEVTVLSKNKDGTLISIGFSGPKVPLNRLPGWEPESWAYHGDDGMVFSCTSSGKPFGPKFNTADVIGCGVNFRTGQAFFTKNGVLIGHVFKDLKGDRLYPAVGMKKSNEQLRVNFGQTPFVFDIDTMLAKERSIVEMEVERTSVTSLAPNHTESQLIHKLVAQYLAHEGYVETARAFSEEVRTESTHLANGTSGSGMDLVPGEDIHAIQRQRIRSAILQGDIDSALVLTQEHYPMVLRDNENTYFKLRCRKFVEMIRRTNEAQSSSSSSTNGTLPAKKPSIREMKARAAYGSTNKHNEDYNDMFDHQMELDEQLNVSHAEDSMSQTDGVALDGHHTSNDANSNGPPSSPSADQLLQEALDYGRELQAEFSDDPRREVKNQLNETFALMAYDKPLESPLSGMLDKSGRAPVAEELNGAILVSLGRSSSATLERLIQQTEFLTQQLANEGHAGAFANLSQYITQ